MKVFLKIIAYFCIATTPIQILIVLWGIQVVLTSDYGVMSLSQIEFINNYQIMSYYQSLDNNNLYQIIVLYQILIIKNKVIIFY